MVTHKSFFPQTILRAKSFKIEKKWNVSTERSQGLAAWFTWLFQVFWGWYFASLASELRLKLDRTTRITLQKVLIQLFRRPGSTNCIATEMKERSVSDGTVLNPGGNYLWEESAYFCKHKFYIFMPRKTLGRLHEGGKKKGLIHFKKYDTVWEISHFKISGPYGFIE